MQAESILKKLGFDVRSKNAGEVMLVAASQNQIGIIKFFMSNTYTVNYQNGFGDSMLHFAARTSVQTEKDDESKVKENKACKMVHYLILKGGKIDI